MSESVGAHVSTLLMRSVGTMIGGVLGYIIAELCESNTIALIATLTTVNLLSTMGRANPRTGYVFVVVGFTAIVIAVGHDPSDGGTVSDFAFNRIQQTLYDTSAHEQQRESSVSLQRGTIRLTDGVLCLCLSVCRIGVLIALVVQVMIFPLKASALLQKEMLTNLARVREASGYSFGRYTQREREAQMQSRPTSVTVSSEQRPPPFSSPRDAPTVEMAAISLEMPMQSKSADAAASNELNPAHSFAVLGPVMMRSVDSQSALCQAADQEPRLWRAPIPTAAYQRVIQAQRSIVLCLFLMDLSLQRMRQSNSHYLMPDLAAIFTRLRQNVSRSLRRIIRGVETYNSRNDRSLPEATPEQADNLLQSSPGLQSLHAELEELEARYKVWIDQTVLARRLQGDTFKQQEEPHRQHDGASTVPWRPAPLRPSVSHALQPIPLHTPRQGPHQLPPIMPAFMLAPRRMHTPSASQGSQPIPAGARAGLKSADALSTVQSGKDDHASAVALSASALPLASLSHMAFTFTRSMDVLSLNCFLYASRESVQPTPAATRARFASACCGG